MIEYPSILISDDDVGFRETLSGLFEPRGFRTLLAGDGEEALHIVRTQEVHLLLLDVHMPKLTGLEVLERVRQFRLILPCILMSAHLDDSIVEQAQRAQAFSILAKPITRQHITRTVDQAFERAYRFTLPRRLDLNSDR